MSSKAIATPNGPAVGCTKRMVRYTSVGAGAIAARNWPSFSKHMELPEHDAES